jgi:DNA-binding response OmpR family regulator
MKRKIAPPLSEGGDKVARLQPLRVLLIESDEYSMDVLKNFLRLEFPDVDVETTFLPAMTMQLLENKGYDILVCDAHLRHNERISYVAELCQETGLVLIVITGDSDLKPEAFSLHLNSSCIHEILYKPLQLDLLRKSIQCAIARVGGRKAGQQKQKP